MSLISRLPHSGAALFIRSIRELDEDRIVCAATVGAESPFNDCGHVPSFVALEIAAQAAALLEVGRLAAMEDEGGQRQLEVNTQPSSASWGSNPVPSGGVIRPLTGYLARVRGLRMSCDDFSAGDEVIAEVRRLSAVSNLAIYECQVATGGNDILLGQFTTFVDLRAIDS